MYNYLQNKFVLSALITIFVLTLYYIYKKNRNQDNNYPDQFDDSKKEYGIYGLLVFFISVVSMFSIQYFGNISLSCSANSISGGNSIKPSFKTSHTSPLSKSFDKSFSNMDYIIGEPDF